MEDVLTFLSSLNFTVNGLFLAVFALDLVFVSYIAVYTGFVRHKCSKLFSCPKNRCFVEDSVFWDAERCLASGARQARDPFSLVLAKLASTSLIS